MISGAHVSVGGALAASSLLGIGVRSGHVRLGRWRRLHHVMYAASLGTAATAMVVDGARRRPTWPVAAATLGVLALLPSTHGGSRPHIGVAASATAVYVIGTAAVTLRHARRTPD